MTNFYRMLFSFLNRKDRRYFIALLILMAVTAVIELVGIGSLFPYIKILENPNLIHHSNGLKWGYHFFHFTKDNDYLIAIGIIIFLMIVLKGVMNITNNYCQAKFSYQLNNRLSDYCLKSFLQMSYRDAINVNSSVLSKHLLVDVSSIASVLTAILTILTDSFVAAALVGLMIWVDPLLVSTVVLVLSFFLWISTATTKNRIKKLAKENEYGNRQAYKTASEALSGLKDIKIFGVEQYFIQRFLVWQKKLSTQLIAFNVISNVPAIAMNVMGFGILLVILLFLIVTKGNLMTVLPLIGLIAVCVQRLLPSASRISVAIGVVRRFKPVVAIVRKAFDNLSAVTEIKANSTIHFKNLSFTNSLQLKNVSFRYPDVAHDALSNISLTIKKNTALGIIGTSGAGKSTLVDVLLGLLPIAAGEIWCDQRNITHDKNMVLSSLVGYVPQQTFLLDGTLLENIAFGVSQEDIDQSRLLRAVRVSQLQSFIETLPHGLETEIGEKGVKLSGGQRQRLGIARALYRNPMILILDEATNALDANTEKEFNQSLLNLMTEMTIIIVAHRLSSLAICDELIQLEQGKIVAQGSRHELMSTLDHLFKNDSLLAAAE